MQSKLSLSLCLALALPLVGLAHTNEYLDTIDGAHGGQLRMSGPFHFELVASPGELTVYVTDHGDTAIDTAGGSAIALVRTGTRKLEMALQPAGGNVFRGNGNFELGATTTVHLKITLSGAAPEMASFKPLRKRAKSVEHKDHQKAH